jgi:hypothetical protein
MHEVLRDPIFSLNIIYLEGSPLIDADLYRAKADLALAIFIMGNKFSVDPDVEDAKSILQQFSIQRYIKNSPIMEEPLYCMQLIRPENKKHVTSVGMVNDIDKEIIICLNEMKMGVIAKTVTFPGFSTLIFNLLCSFSDESRVGTNENKDEDDDDDSEALAENWRREYRKGCDWEIYSTNISEAFVGSRFIDIALLLHKHRGGVLLFALRICPSQPHAKPKFLLNPAEFVIPPLDQCSIEGFVIAKNKGDSDLSFANNQDDGSHIKDLVTRGLTNTLELARKQTVGQFGADSAPKHKLTGIPKKGSNGWQILRSAPKLKEIDLKSQQEALQKIDDDYLKTNYFIRNSPISLEEATITDTLFEDYPHMTDHLIIIGKDLSNLYDLIRPLRARYLGKLRYIVILYPSILPHNVWRRISIFEGVLVVRGSPLEESDIRRTGIFRANQVIVLASEVKSDKSDKSDSLVDADAIFCYQCVKRLNERANVVVEIVRHQNVRYLDATSQSDDSENAYKFSAQFAAGCLFTSSMLDTIVCQVP